MARILTDKEEISYTKTQQFFKERTNKYKGDNPYSLTMYQDNHPELVKARNEMEVKELLPRLSLNEDSRILDIACGIGRWSDAIDIDIKEYCGVDFCEEFIELAKKRNVNRPNRNFYVSSCEKAADCMKKKNKDNFNRILFIGCFVYLNDKDVVATLDRIEKICKNNTIICIREPIGIKERLTLKDHFSEELKDSYNAIYRTREEYISFFESTLLNKGFLIKDEGFLFKEQKLNNRKETAQYYFILSR